MSTPPQQKELALDNNAQLYDEWAKVYDSDGNVLQQLDSLAFHDTVIPLLNQTKTPLNILELGCGTGRNTVLLKQHAPAGSTIYATDISQNMMEEAKRKIAGLPSDDGSEGSTSGVNVKWALLDLQTQQKELKAFVAGGKEELEEADRPDVVISTLVLEHVELDAFFSVVGSMVKPGGWAWVTDMHPEMGQSRAAFYKQDGTKIIGVSFMHAVEDKIRVAKEYGLELVGEVDSRGVGDVEEEALQQFGARSKKWVGKKMLCGMLFRKT